jgi:tetratricopeptide (TPR) repeat protein
MHNEILKDTGQQNDLMRQWVDWHRRSLGETMEFVRWRTTTDFLLGNLSTSDGIALDREAIGIMERAFDNGDSSVIETFREFDANEPFAATLKEKLSDLLMKQWKEMDAAGRERIVNSLESIVSPYSAAKGGDLQALSLLREILLVRRASANTKSDVLSNAIRNLGDALATVGYNRYREGKAAEAVPLLREALPLWQELESMQTSLDDRDRISERILRTESELGSALSELREFDEAHALLSRAYTEIRRRRGQQSSATQIALGHFIDYYSQRGMQEEAARYESLRPAIALRGMRDLGNVSLLRPGFYGYLPSGARSFSVSIGSRSAWIFEPFESGTKWGVRQEGSPQEFSVRESSASLAAKPFLELTNTESAFNTEHLLENCRNDGCQSRWSLSVRLVTADPARNRALITYSKNLLEFASRPTRAGTSLAIWQNPEEPADRLELRPAGAEPTLMFGADEPEWGSAALSADGLLYTYACSDTPKSKNTSTCLLAKVPLERALDREAWQFYTGASWNADWRRARPVLRLDRGATIAVHWNAYLKQYLAISTSLVDRRIHLRVANRPEGPWSQPLIRLDLLDGRPSDRSEAAAGHPELARDGGRIEYITSSYDGVRVLEIEFK